MLCTRCKRCLPLCFYCKPQVPQVNAVPLIPSSSLMCHAVRVPVIVLCAIACPRNPLFSWTSAPESPQGPLPRSHAHLSVQWLWMHALEHALGYALEYALRYNSHRCIWMVALHASDASGSSLVAAVWRGRSQARHHALSGTRVHVAVRLVRKHTCACMRVAMR